MKNRDHDHDHEPSPNWHDWHAYTYDANGNILTETCGGKTTTYTYDWYNRLTREDNEAQGKTYVYTYVAGNLATRKEYAYTTGTVSGTPITDTWTYESGWTDVLATWNGKTIFSQNGYPVYIYDTAAGFTNQASALTWFRDGLLASYKPNYSQPEEYTYTYNAAGQRTEKQTSTHHVFYYYAGDRLVGLRGMRSGDTVVPYEIRFKQNADGEYLGLRYDGNDYYYVKNLQGDVVAIVNASNTPVVQYRYDAWGRLLSTTGSLAATLGADNPIRYRSYLYDDETGYYYLNSRYYNPDWGRFLTPDTDDVLDATTEIADKNLFAYCFYNPVNLKDDDGEWPSWATKVLCSVGVVACIAVVAAITVSTAGAGTAAALIAVGALKGSAIGLASGAVIGSAAGAINHRKVSGSWNGAGKAALDGMGNGALSGAISGAITGAASNALKVFHAAKCWDQGTFKSSFKSMKYHYKKHVIKEGLSKGNNIVKYTKDAIRFSNRNRSLLRYTFNWRYNNATWNYSYSFGKGGMFTSAGKIVTFWYRSL